MGRLPKGISSPKKKCKPGRGVRKGGNFERHISRMLSRWWSGGTAEDIFWRTAGSGGMATRRGKQGKKTYGQYSDINAVDPIGTPLTQTFIIECKNGYSGLTCQDLIDRKKAKANSKGNLHAYEIWLRTCLQNVLFSDCFSFLLIVQRNSRDPLIFFPIEVQKELPNLKVVENYIILNYKRKQLDVRIKGMLLQDFLDNVSPQDVIALHKRVF